MKSIFSSTRLSLAVAGIGIALFFSACNKFDDNDSNNTPVAGLMAFNLAPGKTATLTLGGNVITNSPLPFTNYTGGYLSIYPGNREFNAYDYSNGDTIATSTFNFEPNKYYSAFVVGSTGTYRNVIVRDNFDSLAASSDKAYVRYINAINDGSSPTVKISASGTDVFNQPAAFATVSDFKAVTPGSVDVVASNGSNINSSRTITLEGMKAYTVLLVGTPGATNADSVQVKFIANGTLTESAQQRASASSARSAN